MQPRGAQDLAPTQTYKAPITLRVGPPGAYVSPINHHREAPQNGQEDTGPLRVGRHGPSLGIKINTLKKREGALESKTITNTHGVDIQKRRQSILGRTHRELQPHTDTDNSNTANNNVATRVRKSISASTSSLHRCGIFTSDINGCQI